MPINDIVGQQLAVRSLLGFIKRAQLPHAMLFVGPDGCGKRTTALAFAQAVNCASPRDGDACGKCESCHRTAAGIDLDALVYVPARLNLRRDEADVIRAEAMITPNTGKRKFIILDRADYIESESANLLLKIIEEPPANTVFILLAANEHLLLPTIRSRVLKVPFKPLSPADAQSVLGDRMPAESVRYLYGIARGDAGMIVRMSEDESFSQAVAQLEDFIKTRLNKPSIPLAPSMLAQELATIAQSVKLPKSEGETDAAADRKSLLFSLDVILVYVEKKYRMLIESGRATPGSLKWRQLSVCCSLLETVMGTQKAIRGGCNTNLALESMCLTYRKTMAVIAG